MSNAPPPDPAPAPDAAPVPASPSEPSDAHAADASAADEDAVAADQPRDAQFAAMAEDGHAQLHDDQFAHMAETELPNQTEAVMLQNDQSEPQEGDAARSVSALNQQITDMVAAIEAAMRADTTTGLQLASDMAAAQAAALAMFNAVQAQQRDAMLANAAMTRVLSRLAALSRAPLAAAAASPSQEKPNV